MINQIQKEKISEIIKSLIRPMNLEAEIMVHEETNGDKEIAVAAISAPEGARYLIGKNGQNLQALEHVARTILSKDQQAISLFVDVNNYRKGRVEQIATLAREAVARVRSTQRAEALAPMSSYERRIVHMELASVSDITTESIGQEPQRRIVVKPYRII